jgi:predicted HicB family RNase H-like nuclease
MDTKLTLIADKEIIEKAKQYAKSQKISLSRLIESYLSSLTSEKSEEIEISPLVKA